MDISLIQMAFEQVEYAINITDTRGMLLAVNRAYLDLYKFGSPGEVIGRRQNLIRSPATALSVYKNMWATITAGRTWKGELTNRAADGTDVFIHLTITPLKQDGDIVAYMGFSLDRRQQILLERQLFQANKLVMLSGLGAGLSHELNNPLTSMLLEAEFLADELGRPEGEPDRGQVRASVAAIQQGIMRIKKMTGQFLEYTRPETASRLEILALEELLEESRLLLESRLESAGVELRVSLEPDMLVLAHRIQLRSVFQNLLTNSLDAFGARNGSARAMEIRGRILDTHWLEIRCLDNAGGIPTEALPLIFDPFFTTRGERKQSGLGLTLARKILADHGGTISCDSRDGCTEFLIELPRASSDAGNPPASARP